MTTSIGDKSKHNSWTVRISTALIFMLVCSLPMSSISVLFKEISRDLNLNAVQIGSVWGMIFFGNIFVAPLGGILCDRLGAKRVISMLGVMTGLIGALLGISNGFLSLIVIAFLWGMLSSAIIPAINMMASKYSSIGNQGLAQGLLAAGSGLGLTVGSLISATVLSPLLGGWRHVFFLLGGIAVLVSIIWHFRLKEPDYIKPMNSGNNISLRYAFAHLLSLKSLWFITLSVLAYQCCITGMQGFLPYYLENKGWSVVAASGSLAAYMSAVTIGVIPLSLISDKIGSRKIPILAAFLSAVIGVGLLSIVHNGLLWVIVILIGLFTSTSGALFTTMCIENKEVGSSYSATAVGLMLAIGGIGKAFSPPLGNSLANISTTIAWPFILWAALGAVGIIIFIFIKETGDKNRKIQRF